MGIQRAIGSNWQHSAIVGAWNDGSVNGSNEWAFNYAKSGDGGNNDIDLHNRIDR